MRRPDSYASLQPTHSTIVSIINPSYRCLPAASKDTALPRSHLPHQPNPHSGVRGILRGPSPAGSFIGGFRTPATGVCRAAVAGRHPKPYTRPDMRSRRASAPGPTDGYFLSVRRGARDLRDDVPKLRGPGTCVLMSEKAAPGRNPA